TRRIDVQRVLSREAGAGPQFADHSRTEYFGKANPAVPVFLLARDAADKNEWPSCAAEEPRHLFQGFLRWSRRWARREPCRICNFKRTLQMRLLQARVQAHISGPFRRGTRDLECAQKRFA